MLVVDPTHLRRELSRIFLGDVLSQTSPNAALISLIITCLCLCLCDVILERTSEGVQPKLLEVTFVPSNSAVNSLFSKQYPSYVNDVFGVLFLGEENPNLTRLL
jgi:hypothetical protein